MIACGFFLLAGAIAGTSILGTGTSHMDSHFIKDRHFYARVFAGTDNSQEEVSAFFHGFPGESTRQNFDFAEKTVRLSGKPVYQIVYSGLGEAPGKFSFKRSLDESRAFLDYLRVRYKRVNIVAHSWGAFVALNALHDSQIEHSGKITLLNPLTFLPEKQHMPAILDSVLAEFPHLKDKFEANSSLLQEIEDLRIRNIPLEFADKLKIKPGQLNLLQSKEDSEVPPSTSKDFSMRLQVKHNYELVDSDHSFLVNREVVFKRLYESLWEAP